MMRVSLALAFFLAALGIAVWPSTAVSESVLDPANEPKTVESLLSMRDPFKRPDVAKSEFKPRSDLEAYPVQQYQFMGIMTGPRLTRAMIQTPGNKVFYVSRGDFLGNRAGKIVSISARRIVVREKIVNVLGQAENVSTELTMNMDVQSKLGVVQTPKFSEAHPPVSAPPPAPAPAAAPKPSPSAAQKGS